MLLGVPTDSHVANITQIDLHIQHPPWRGAQDADGSGAIDAGELGAALSLLGLRATPAEVAAMLDSVGSQADGEIEFPQFVNIMTDVLTRPPAQVDADSLPVLVTSQRR